MAVTITPQMWMLVMLMIENALAAAFSTISTMTPEEIESGISFEEAKKSALMSVIQAH